MMTRIYAVTFPKQKELTEYLELLEEAKNAITASWERNWNCLCFPTRWDRPAHVAAQGYAAQRKIAKLFEG